MVRRDTLSHSESVFFVGCLAAALVHVHRMGFVHRDIKPENCLIGKDGFLKLCDFGMAKRLPSTILLPKGGTEVVTLAFTMCGTPEFMAPEYILSTGYDKGVDWWALGCLLVEMCTGRSPFEFNGDLKATFKEVCLIGMGRKKYNPPDNIKKPGMELVCSLIEGLLSPASARLGRDDDLEVVRHAYFATLDFNEMRTKNVTPPYVPRISHLTDTSHFRTFEYDVEESVAPYEGDSEWCHDF